MSQSGVDEEEFSMRPSKAALIALALLVSPGVVLGVMTWVYADGRLAGSILFCGAVLIWLSVGSLRVVAASGNVSMHRFGRTLWSTALADIVLREGLGGDIPILPALVVVGKTRKPIRYILKSQFRTSDLEKLRRLVQAENSDRPGAIDPAKIGS
jgi:hypothetical protein